MKIQDYKDREVQMVSYEFDQETDREGQMVGIPRGGKIRVRVKALNDGTPELLAGRRDSVLGDQDPEGDEDHQVHWRLLRRFRGELGRQARSL